jgi:YHYH protein
MMKLRFFGLIAIVAALLIMLSFAIPKLSSSLRSQPMETPIAVSQLRDPIGEADLKQILNHIPIGDGRISTRPKVGSVWSCRTRFGRSGGAHASGAWIHGDGTYDLMAKPTVDGAVQWPSQFQMKQDQTIRSIDGNRLPNDPTGEFPVSPSDDAYAFDRNPNTITPATYHMLLPTNPEVAESPSCLPLGEVGVLVNGGYFFNALDARGEDAVAHEMQDSCQGHPERTGTYHYHSVTTCLDKQDTGSGHSALMGYALDGFGIYGHRGETGKWLTNADLDVCHGHTHPIEWDQKSVNLYHYHATWEYPYTIGCYRGQPVSSTPT